MGAPECAAAGKGMEKAMQERGLKMAEFVAQFNLEVLNKGSDFDTMLLTITDARRRSPI